MLESKFQTYLINEALPNRLPGCFVSKLDSGYTQGIPDLLVLFGKYWAVLEVKRSGRDPYQPNQEYYLDVLGAMSFSATIYPENESEVLNALQRSFKSRRPTRFS